MSLHNDIFTQPLLDWYDCHGRNQLPWQHPRSAYFVWLSEIMLQQTQVKTVIPYFNRFVNRFPTIAHLSRASEDDVLNLWSGLGYYARGRNLHKTAKIIVNEYQEIFPQCVETLATLPGIGRSTAAAISAQAFNQPTAILDANVKRVLSRFFLIDGDINRSSTIKQLWNVADQCMPTTRCADYTQAIMDFGATCCRAKKPLCNECPIQNECKAYHFDSVEDYPVKKKSKPLPEKHRQFLLIYDQNHQIYLEKRPANGIWGGLWGLPEIDIDESAKAHIEAIYPLHVMSFQSLKSIKHSFTHFHLYIKALAIKTKPHNDSTLPMAGVWFSSEETSKLGLAKPIMDLIKVFYNDHPLRVAMDDG